MFNELVNEIISLIESRESRERSRTEKEQSSFQYSVEFILKDLWLAKPCMSLAMKDNKHPICCTLQEHTT